uniref:Uncharacterized protein n=2 Tax=Parascaris univalens TaxID=6257 RepID=A0A915BMH9_PARUN
SDSRGRPLPRQLLRVQRSEPEEGVLRTELRFVVYQRKSDFDEEGSTEAGAVVQALEALLKKFSEMNDDPSKNKSAFIKREKANDWSTLAEKRLKMLNDKLSMLERSAAQIAPEVASFQVQLQSLLGELDERKKGGQSPSAQLDAKFREKLQKLRDYAIRNAIVTPTTDPVVDVDRLSWSSNGYLH